MKKAPIVALGILAVLAGVFFLLRKTPTTTIKTPMTLHALKHITRVEAIRPEGKKREMVVFERSDGEWWISSPIDARVSQQADAELSALFARPIATDDRKLDAQKLDEYGLDKSSALRLSVYRRGEEQAARELDIGNEIRVPRTGVRRTYIKKTGEPGVYRAQAGLGDFWRKPLSELRTHQVVDLDASAIRALNISASQPAADDVDKAQKPALYKLKLIHKDYVWAMVEPQPAGSEEVGHALDVDKVNALASAIAELRAEKFVDDKQPEAVGLKPARTTLMIESVTGTHILRLGDAAGGQNIYARFDDGPIFTLSQSTGARLHPSADSLLKTPAKQGPDEDAASAGAAEDRAN